VGFSAEWLALREPADHGARSVSLTRTALETLPRNNASILDLAAGTGSNLRFVTNVHRGRPGSDLPGTIGPEWLLVDHDAVLLAQVPKMSGVETRCLDLATLDQLTIFDGRSIVTASALLDLVSENWLHHLLTGGRGRQMDRRSRERTSAHRQRIRSGVGARCIRVRAAAVRAAGLPGAAGAKRLGDRAKVAGASAADHRRLGERCFGNRAPQIAGDRRLASPPPRACRGQRISPSGRTRRSSRNTRAGFQITRVMGGC
jgi:hypothetical protein